MNGLERILEFLDQLQTLAIPANLTQFRSGAIAVCFGTTGYRFEVEFFVDHVEYSMFTGLEDASSDLGRLIDTVKQHCA